MASAPGSPCGACKFLRRKCSSDCIFAPYFSSEQGAARFAAIHKVFGASNASKLLLHVPPADRCEAAVTIAFEAQARLHDPVYGCVGRIFALQHQVAGLQMQLMQAKAQIAQRALSLQSSSGSSSQWQAGNSITNFDSNPPMLFQPYSSSSSPSPSSWESCMSSSSSSSSNSHGSCSDYLMISNQGHYSAGISSPQDGLYKEFGSSKKLWVSHAEMGELQDLAFSMIGNM